MPPITYDAAPPDLGRTLSLLPPARRFTLQSRGDRLATVAGGLGWPLPAGLLRARREGTRASLALGPTEWLLLEWGGDGRPQPRAEVNCAYSLVDVSDRHHAIELTGPDAAVRLATGCPLDLSLDAFGTDMCTRTIFGRCEIVLWRTSADTWRVEFWRSFLQYVRGMLLAPI